LSTAKGVGVSLPANSFLKNSELRSDEYAPIRLAARQSKKSFNSGERGTSRWKDNRGKRLKWLHENNFLVHWDLTHNPPWGEGDIYNSDGDYLGNLCPHTGCVPSSSKIIIGRYAVPA